LHPANNKENTIVFIHEASENPISTSFTGFTMDELAQLKSMGVQNISIYRTKDNGKDYITLTSGFVSLDSLPIRTSTHRDLENSTSEASATANVGLIIGIIFVIIVVLIIAYFISGANWFRWNGSSL
jgi:hypothetical protein